MTTLKTKDYTRHNVFKSNTGRYFVACFLLICLALFVPFIFSSKDVGVDAIGVNKLENLIYEDSDESHPITLPDNMDCSENEEYSLITKLPESFDSHQFISFLGYHSTFVVYIDNKEIYKTPANEASLTKATANLWRFVEIPKGSANKELKITFKSPYGRTSGKLYEIYYGTHDELQLQIIEKNDVQFFTSVGVLLLGLILFLLAFITHISKQITASMLYLACFTVSVSLWFMSESNLLQFYIDNEFIITNLKYIALLSTTYPLIMLFRTSYENHGFNPLIYATYVFSLNAALQVILQMTGILDFTEMLYFTHISIFIVSILIAISLIKETFIYQNTIAKSEFIHILVFCTFVILELVNFYLDTPIRSTVILSMGMIYYVLSRTYLIVKQITKMRNDLYSAQEEAKLAFIDQLTGGNNRMAFYKDFEDCMNNNSSPLYLIMFDLNNLKIINDHYGHHSGDRAISDTYHCMDLTFGKKGKCYRIGGDEFTAIIAGVDDIDIESIINNFHKEIANIDSITAYPFSVAVGYSYTEDLSHISMDTLSARADKNLYKNKELMKSAKHV